MPKFKVTYEVIQTTTDNLGVYEVEFEASDAEHARTMVETMDPPPSVKPRKVQIVLGANHSTIKRNVREVVGK